VIPLWVESHIARDASLDTPGTHPLMLAAAFANAGPEAEAILGKVQAVNIMSVTSLQIKL
jgi:hypothetical protein